MRDFIVQKQSLLFSSTLATVYRFHTGIASVIILGANLGVHGRKFRVGKVGSST